MRSVVYILIGLFFGIVMYKSEAASWFRIFEMFEFGSFHMYGIIGSALLLGIAGIRIIKRFKIRGFGNCEIHFNTKAKGFKRYLFGGIIFGLGWALAGSCPGPIYVLAGAGYISLLLVLGGAVFGTFLYGILRHKLPH